MTQLSKQFKIQTFLNELGDPRFDSGKKNLFLFSETSRIVLGLYATNMQWTPEALSPGTDRSGMKMTAHVNQAPR
jgi:hypothetical protein